MAQTGRRALARHQTMIHTVLHLLQKPSSREFLGGPPIDLFAAPNKFCGFTALPPVTLHLK